MMNSDEIDEIIDYALTKLIKGLQEDYDIRANLTRILKDKRVKCFYQTNASSNWVIHDWAFKEENFHELVADIFYYGNKFGWRNIKIQRWI